MKPKDIANLFGISKQRVNYWLHIPLTKRTRRTKLTRKEIYTIIKGARDKPIMKCRFQQKIYNLNLINYRKR